MGVDIWTITASGDDAIESRGDTAYSDTGITLNTSGHVSDDAERMVAGLIFRDVGDTLTSADDPTIAAAFLRLVAIKGGANNDPLLDIYAEESAAPAAWSASDSPADRYDAATMTAASVEWDDTDLTNAVAHDSPDIAAIIREWLDDVTVGTGADLAIIMRGTDTATRTSGWAAYDHTTEDPPELHVAHYIAKGRGPGLAAGKAATSKEAQPDARSAGLVAGRSSSSSVRRPLARSSGLIVGRSATTKSVQTSARAPLLGGVRAATSSSRAVVARGALLGASRSSSTKTSRPGTRGPLLVGTRATPTDTDRNAAGKAPLLGAGLSTTTTGDTIPTVARGAGLIVGRCVTTKSSHSSAVAGLAAASRSSSTKTSRPVARGPLLVAGASSSTTVRRPTLRSPLLAGGRSAITSTRTSIARGPLLVAGKARTSIPAPIVNAELTSVAGTTAELVSAAGSSSTLSSAARGRL